MIIADERRVVLAYRVQSAEISDGKTVRIDDPEGKEPIALVRLESHAHMFGPPNDEAFRGHPLAKLAAASTYTELFGLKVHRGFASWRA